MESPLGMSDRETGVTGDVPVRKWFIQELWEELRPYVLHISKDLIIYLLLRSGIWLSHLLGHYMPVDGWVDDYLKNMHAIGIVGSFAVFIGLSIWHAWQVGKHVRRK